VDLHADGTAIDAVEHGRRNGGEHDASSKNTMRTGSIGEAMQQRH
jgi:hypothetical protein